MNYLKIFRQNCSLLLGLSICKYHNEVKKINKTNTPKSIVTALIISIIFISFSAIFVKWSNAPATILSMYRLILATIFISPIVWIKRDEFKKLAQKDWLFLFLSGLFLAMHFALWF